jgi:hypothetical protein
VSRRQIILLKSAKLLPFFKTEPPALLKALKTQRKRFWKAGKLLSKNIAAPCREKIFFLAYPASSMRRLVNVRRGGPPLSEAGGSLLHLSTGSEPSPFAIQ